MNSANLVPVSKHSVATSLQQAVSNSQITASVAEDILDRLDDVALAGCSGISPDDIDSEEVTLFLVMIDASGSMITHRDAVIREYNESLLKPVSGAKNADSILVSTILFSESPGKPDIRLLHGYTPVKQCPKLTKVIYEPDGGTPLYKCVHIGETGIFNYGNTLISSGVRVKFIAVVISDGEENASRGFTTSVKLKKFSSDLLATETCVLAYIYLGNPNETEAQAKIKGDAYASEIGFPSQHRLTQETKNGGDSAIRKMFGTLSASLISASQASVSASSMSTNAFFVNP